MSPAQGLLGLPVQTFRTKPTVFAFRMGTRAAKAMELNGSRKTLRKTRTYLFAGRFCQTCRRELVGRSTCSTRLVLSSYRTSGRARRETSASILQNVADQIGRSSERDRDDLSMPSTHQLAAYGAPTMVPQPWSSRAAAERVTHTNAWR